MTARGPYAPTTPRTEVPSMTDDLKPIAVSIYDYDEKLSPNPAIVQTVDGKQYAVDHLQRRQCFLRLINFETEACNEVTEVVDFPHHRIRGIQRYPLSEGQTKLLSDGAADE